MVTTETLTIDREKALGASRAKAVSGSSSGVAFARDLLALTKPRITVNVLITGGAGLALAPGHIASGALALSLAGTVLVVSAANALNMWWERDIDGLMSRTCNRPLPAGRMRPEVALVFGLVLGALSVPMLFAVKPLTGILGLFALVSYVLVYTPLKRRTPWALEVGAVPGAIPPLLGWTSVTGTLDKGALALFAIMFLWQIPHFIAITLFRTDDYARAGLRVHAVARGEAASRKAIFVSTVLLLLGSLTPFFVGLAGAAYLVACSVLGGVFLWMAAKGLGTGVQSRWSRQVFGYSILYLMILLGSLIVDKARLSA